MNELWKIAIEGYYEVSNYGNVRSLDRYVEHPQGRMRLKGKDMKISMANTGYKQVEFRVNGKRETWRIHNLVALLFVENSNPDLLTQINHIDGDKFNNKANNLEWCTCLENIRHAFSLNLIPRKKGAEMYNAKLNDESVREIRRLYSTGKYTQSALDKLFGVGEGTVNKIVRNLAWKHVK